MYVKLLVPGLPYNITIITAATTDTHSAGSSGETSIPIFLQTVVMQATFPAALGGVFVFSLPNSMRSEQGCVTDTFVAYYS